MIKNRGNRGLFQKTLATFTRRNEKRHIKFRSKTVLHGVIRTTGLSPTKQRCYPLQCGASKSGVPWYQKNGKYNKEEPARQLSAVTHVSGLEESWCECAVPVLPGQCWRLEIDRPELLPLIGRASTSTLGGPHHRGGILPRLRILVFLSVRVFSHVGRWLRSWRPNSCAKIPCVIHTSSTLSSTSFHLTFT
jgi:hypothetical protein